MKVFLEGLLPRLLPQHECEVFDYRSKDNLLKKLPDRLKGYEQQILRSGFEELRVVVLIDRDDDDCKDLKKQLEQFAATAGLRTLSAARPAPSQALNTDFYVVNRVVCEELEAWYFGDPAACEQAYRRLKIGNFKPAHLQNPDAIVGGTWEAFGRTLHAAGHLSKPKPASNEWKYEAARLLGQHVDPDRNQSPSFQAFVAGVRAF